jgi:hypothetical protein
VALTFVWPIMVISITLLMLTCNVPEIQMRMKGKQPYMGR